MRKIFGVFLGLLALASGSAWAFTAGVKGGASASFYNSSEIRLGYGWTAGVSLSGSSPTWFTEVDALVSKVVFPYTEAAQDQSTLLRVPALIGLRLDRNFAVGIGGFFSMGLGKVKTGDTAAESTYEEAQLSRINYGGALGLEMRTLVSGLTLTLDARFYLGLSKADTVTTTLRQNSAEVLLGFLF